MADEQAMTGPEARAIRERLGLRVEDVAGLLALTPHVVEGWESGAARVPREVARDLRWRDAVAAREAAIQASGLPECEWVRDWAARMQRPGARMTRGALAELETHAAGCAVCQAREEFARTLPPLPERPAGPTPLIRLKAWIDQRPQWLRAPLWLATGFAAYSAIRALLHLTRTIGYHGSFDVPLGDFARVPARAAFGFAIGLVWSAFGPLRRRGGAMLVVANALAVVGILLLLALLVPLRDALGD